MSFLQVCREGYKSVKRPRGLLLGLLLVIGFISAYPTNFDSYHTGERHQPKALVIASENYIRFGNVLLPVVLLVVHRDLIGLVQVSYVALVGTMATHGLKRALNDVAISGTRLGQRPIGPSSKHNMPSGHSSLASGGAFFVCRRYGWRWGLFTLPVLLLTVYARLELLEHTYSAVLTGSLIGLFVCLLFVSRHHKKNVH